MKQINYKFELKDKNKILFSQPDFSRDVILSYMKSILYSFNLNRNSEEYKEIILNFSWYNFDDNNQLKRNKDNSIIELKKRKDWFITVYWWTHRILSFIFLYENIISMNIIEKESFQWDILNRLIQFINDIIIEEWEFEIWFYKVNELVDNVTLNQLCIDWYWMNEFVERFFNKKSKDFFINEEKIFNVFEMKRNSYKIAEESLK